jgi:pyruvate dehydrogenase E1 component alpha subunit
MNLNKEICRELLFCMKRIREIEETIAERYAEQKMRCPTHLCTGQEAVASAVGLALRKDDFVMSTHRAHGHYLGKGGNLHRMLAEIYGKATGCSGGKGGSMHLVDKEVGFMGSTAIVGSSIPIGVGLGLSIKLQNTDQVSCIFLGDGATEEGVFYESVNFAVLKQLPVLFICENNLYSVYSPLDVRQPAGRRIHEMVKAMGISSQAGNGNNVVEIYLKVSEAVELIRQKGGPYFFEFHTYRWREHCGPNFDNNIGYRTEEEFLSWKAQDPILSCEQQLLDQQWISSEEIVEMQESIKNEVKVAFDFAEKSPFPRAEDAFTHLCK